MVSAIKAIYNVLTGSTGTWFFSLINSTFSSLFSANNGHFLSTLAFIEHPQASAVFTFPLMNITAI